MSVHWSDDPALTSQTDRGKSVVWEWVIADRASRNRWRDVIGGHLKGVTGQKGRVKIIKIIE